MLAYTLRRVVATIPVMAIVALFVFSLLYLAPGDPAAIIAGDQASPADVDRIRASLGLDRPFLVRFGEWVWHVLNGDLGTSIFTNLPVTHMIAQRVEPTLSLMVLTLVFSIVVAVPMGVVAAWKHGTIIDRAVMLLAVFGFSVPVFVVGYLMAYMFALQLQWLPVQGYTPIANGVWPWLANLILPSLTLGGAFIALIARITRATMLEVLSQDYVRTARAKGVGQRPILFVHALKNAAVPIVTVIGLGVAGLIGGAVVTESVFAIPGVGRLVVDCDPAARLPDHPGRRADLFLRLRAGEFGRGPALHRVRSEDPLLSITFPGLGPVARATRGSRGGPSGHPAAGEGTPGGCGPSPCRKPTIFMGGLLLALIVFMAIAAPLLGTVDPTALAPARRLRVPSEIYWFGTDMLGRDIYSRTLYGARVSLIVGFSVAFLASVVGMLIGVVRRLCARGGRRDHAGDGRAHVHPLDPARDRADGADPGQRAERDHRHHGGGDPARDAAGARRGAEPARAALCGGGRRQPARARRR